MDGPKVPPEPAKSKRPRAKKINRVALVLSQDKDIKAILEPEKFDPDEVKDKLAKMGITPSMAKRIVLAATNGDGELINRKLAIGASLVFWFNSIAQMEKAQDVMADIVADDGLEAKERIAAGACGAQIASTMVKIGESIIANAEKSSRKDSKGENNEERPVTINQQFNYPPVFSPPARAIEGSGETL